MRRLAGTSQANLARRDSGMQHLSVWKWTIRSFLVGHLQNILAPFLSSHTMFHLPTWPLCVICLLLAWSESPYSTGPSIGPSNSSYPPFCRPQLLTSSQKCRGIISEHESLPVICVSISTMCGWGVSKLKVGEGTLSSTRVVVMSLNTSSLAILFTFFFVFGF